MLKTRLEEHAGLESLQHSYMLKTRLEQHAGLESLQHSYMLNTRLEEHAGLKSLQHRPTQSIMYVPLQVNRFQESILLIVQYRYLDPVPGDFILQNLILRTRSCGTGFITQSRWGFHFHRTTIVRWKCFVPQLYQFPRGISGGPALKYFYMIHRGGRYSYILKTRLE